ncbi:dienelactone hydrolase family protein [Tumebacillus permanentifrigoris]|uniref:Carboxymethylenebutenolidase n=1 Tax=Tumebacillus permanentifrigoris TaxID=378543 RepID=A0A316DC18_9BACL|nr:dienelactone hydrolase family protein [Tumebacillus permanentifrigoris]PWK15687.1 carboxymethylenebutenolidase [Tumebacillus permanentifrigoris]
MTVHTEWVRFEHDGQEVSLYTARMENAQTPLPVVLVIQEIWGTDEHIQHVTRRFAEAGYLSVAPDLFHENGKRKSGLEAERIEAAKKFLDSIPHSAWFNNEEREVELAKLPEPTRTELSETLTALFGSISNGPVFVGILKATVEFLKSYEHSRGQHVASIGFCMGGALSAVLAGSHPDLAGAVVFYGRLSADYVANISCPVIGFFGEQDPGINGMIPDFAQAMQAAGKEFEYQMYKGASHAFFNDTRVSYNVDAARDAFAQSLEFFRMVLVQE